MSVNIRRVVAALEDAATRWSDADFPPRVRATRAAIARTGYTEPVVDYAFDKLFGGITRDALVAVIEDELGSLDALARFVPRAGRPDVRYAPRGTVAIVSSDTTLGVAIPPLAFALCAGCHVRVKDRDDGLVAAFTETLAQEEPALASRIDARAWRGDDEFAASAVLGDAAVVVAYGRADALVAIRARLAPEARFHPFGHRTSIAYVTRDALHDDDAARALGDGIARDTLLYDGDGCLSLHAAFVERGGAIDPDTFARAITDACDRLDTEFPASFSQPDGAAAAYCRSAAFRVAQGEGWIAGGIARPHLVVFDPPRAEPPPLLRRTLAVYPVDDAAEALAFVRAHALGIEGLALATGDRNGDDIAELIVASGTSRVAPVGALQDPPLGGNHGGDGRILPFVRPIYRA